MTLMGGIEQQATPKATRSLANVDYATSPRPSIELRRVKHTNADSGIKVTAGVQGDDSQGPPALRNRVQVISPKARRWLEIQYACLCIALFLAGWNDGTSGPLIPRIQRYYNVNPSTNTLSLLILMTEYRSTLH